MKIITIVVTYNGAYWIEKCISSLINSDVKDHHIIVIDNCSSDNTIDLIEEKFSVVELIKNTKNLGFGKANNIGLKIALQRQADYVFLLNQDAWLEKNTLSKLIETHKLNPDYGIISPIQVNKNGKIDTHFLKFSFNNFDFPLLSDVLLQKKTCNIYEVDFINAASWLLPVNTIREIGGFMPVFTHYGEDNNYCNRAKYFKIKIGITPGIKIVHDRKDSTSKNKLKNFFNRSFVKHLAIITNITTSCLFKLKRIIKLDFAIISNNLTNPLFIFSILYSYLKILLNIKEIILQYKISKSDSNSFL